jgi:predicted phage tail protein
VGATGGANQVTVSWPAVNGATSYNIYYSTTSGVTTAAGTKITGATSPYVQTGLAASTAYYYIVTAVNSAGESPASAQASASTSAPAFDALGYFNNTCLGCHSSPFVRTAAQIQAAITANRGGMGSLGLTAAQIAAIAAVSY